ncbi:MAG: dockerin type I domain-containing protein [Clostridiales bacterium]|nr:dockerin type I domain-containing protein [Clostridiales bacterium]
MSRGIATDSDDDTVYVSIAKSGDSYYIYIKNATNITSVDVKIDTNGRGYNVDALNGFMNTYDFNLGINIFMYKSGSSMGFTSADPIAIAVIEVDTGVVPELGHVAAVGIRNGTSARVDAAVEVPLVPVQEALKLSIRTDTVSYAAVEVEYVLSARDAENLQSIALEFEMDGDMLAFKAIEGLSGFSCEDGVTWALADGNIWVGKITIKHKPEEPCGFTSETPSDIVKLTCLPKALGDATVKLAQATAAGYVNGAIECVDSLIEEGTATTTVENLYTKYDLNRDGTVDALDLGIMLLYCGYVSDSLAWGTLEMVDDSHGKPVTASMCDVNGDGRIDMLDILDLFIHYTK